MDIVKLIGMCEHHFNALEKIEAKEPIDNQEHFCANICNGNYNYLYNHCTPKFITIESAKELVKQRMPRAYVA